MSKTGEDQYIFQKKKTKFALLKTIDFNFKTPTKQIFSKNLLQHDSLTLIHPN